MEVLHTAIEVSDLDATRGFYEDLLGLERTREHEAAGHRNYYVAGTGPAELQFTEVEGPVDPSGIAHIAIETDDVDAILETAVAEWNSSVTREPTDLDRKPIRLGAITDPDGYVVHLIQDQ